MMSHIIEIKILDIARKVLQLVLFLIYCVSLAFFFLLNLAQDMEHPSKNSCLAIIGTTYQRFKSYEGGQSFIVKG